VVLVAGGLSAFVMTPDLHDSLCCGAVAGGFKFCTLGAHACTFSTHVKKVTPLPNHIYVSTGRNSAFTHHRVPGDVLAPDHVHELLKEYHTPKE
jgi:hypothetical protein